jgi:hypothetical protein
MSHPLCVAYERLPLAFKSKNYMYKKYDDKRKKLETLEITYLQVCDRCPNIIHYAKVSSKSSYLFIGIEYIYDDNRQQTWYVIIITFSMLSTAFVSLLLQTL